MGMLSIKDQDTIRDLLANNLKHDVKLLHFTQSQSPLSVPGHECQYCNEERQLLAEVSALSPHLDLEVHDFVAEADLAQSLGVDSIPALELKGNARGRVRFFGLPSGYEFSTLIEDLVDVGNGTTRLTEATRSQLATLSRDVHIQVFVTPT